MNPKEALLTQERLREVLSYNPETGDFIWIKRLSYKVPAGAIAGTTKPGSYTWICIDRFICSAHRLAWFYMTGEWPKKHIDHINCIKSDNRWCNLREATRQQNARNRRCRKDSITQIKGVFLDKGVYRARIIIDGHTFYRGPFKTVAEAHQAFIEMTKEFHGPFARWE